MNITQIIAVAGFISTIAVSTVAIESRYAHEDDVQKIAYRLDQKILEDRMAALQAQLWRLQDRYGPNCGKERNTCRAIRADIEAIKRRLGTRRR